MEVLCAVILKCTSLFFNTAVTAIVKSTMFQLKVFKVTNVM